MSKKKVPNPVAHNPVARHARQFNTANQFVDRKKRLNKGYRKHQNRRFNSDGGSVLTSLRSLITLLWVLFN